MEISNFERSQVLVQALPYIQKYYQKTIVIKYGGNAMINEGLKDAVMTDIVLLSLVGIHVVLCLLYTSQARFPGDVRLPGAGAR